MLICVEVTKQFMCSLSCIQQRAYLYNNLSHLFIKCCIVKFNCLHWASFIIHTLVQKHERIFQWPVARFWTLLNSLRVVAQIINLLEITWAFGKTCCINFRFFLIYCGQCPKVNILLSLSLPYRQLLLTFITSFITQFGLPTLVFQCSVITYLL